MSSLRNTNSSKVQLKNKTQPLVRGLILENTFSSISELVDTIFPWIKMLGPLKDYFLRLKWESIKRIQNIDPEMPIL